MKQHLVEAIRKGVRYDGRKPDEFRKVSVEYGVTLNAEGSARVRAGDCEVIAGVKFELMQPYADTPNEGTLMVNSELTPLASPDFESGPPSIDSIELARVVDRGIRESHAIDVKKLVVKAGEKVWGVSVDIIPLNATGNLIDISGLAVLAALKDAKLPAIAKDGSVDYKTKTKASLPLSKEPIPVTVYVIGGELIVDPTVEEEKAAEARLTISSMDENTICAMQKGGDAPLLVEQIDAMVDLALKKAKELRKAL